MYGYEYVYGDVMYDPTVEKCQSNVDRQNKDGYFMNVMTCGQESDIHLFAIRLKRLLQAMFIWLKISSHSCPH